MFVALVTGASAGIGEATARRIAREPDARVVLVARREDKLQQLAAELGNATAVPVDLTDPNAAPTVRDTIEREHGGQLHMLVNNAGASWRWTFADGGWENMERHMKLNFEAPVRLTEALLPLLRRTAAQTPDKRVSIVNVASTAGRVSRPKAGAYSASKFALIAWTDALHGEEHEHGVHVGMVLPGFIKTEGFPAKELLGKPHTRWLVSEPDVVAEAIMEVGPGGKAERYVPRHYWFAASTRIMLPAVIRRATRGGLLTTATGQQD